MPFIDIARALFAYAPQSTDELAFEENDFLYVLEKGEDDWWKVKKKVDGDDDGPVGLVPRNYLEAVPPISSTRTLYDYTAQTEEELSFSADLSVEIFDKDDPDWFLVRLKGPSTSQEEWEYGFVPSNYLDDGEVESAAKLPSVLPAGRPESLDERRPLTPPMQDDDEREEPISPSNAMTAYGRPEQHYSIRDPSLDSRFKTWQVEEIDSRKRKKRGTLGIGNSSIVWSCEADKTPVQTWPITSLIEYNTEKKHLFIELSSPPAPASFHFHAESRAIASQISDAIGEIAGATRATGLREVAAASGEPLPPLPETSALAQRHKREDSDELLPVDDGVKRGVILYDFEAHDDDELAVQQDQIIEILDDSHEEWWKCKAGNREGVVPASYIDVIKTRPATKKDQNSAASTLAAAITQQRRIPDTSPSLPPAPQEQSSQSLSKPDMSKVRTWVDKSGSYQVEAQFLGVSNDKIQLHKLNGVKISVPKSKMSEADVHYVERLLGRQSSPPPPKPPPDSEKPRPKRIEFDWFTFFLESGVDYNVCQRYALAFEKDQMDESILPEINMQTLRSLGVREGDILRVMKRLDEKFGRASARKKIVRFGTGEVVEDEDEGKDDLSNVVKITQPVERKESLFSSGPSGALRNNTTRRGRPTTGKTAPEEVDGTLLSTPTAEQEQPETERHGVRPLRVPPSRLVNYPQKSRSSTEGFDDDAWAVKQQPPKPQSPTVSTPIVSSPVQLGPPPGSAIHELASISPPNVSQSLPPPLQPQNTVGIVQLSLQPTASPVVNRPSSVPPTQAIPQTAPLQPHYTGIPSQQPYNAPTPAQASGTPSLNEQLTKLQLYRQQQMVQPQPTGFVPQYQPGYTNGLQPTVQQPTGMPLQPQPTGFMPTFLPPGQQNSQLGPTRSFSLGLPPPLIPTNPLSSPTQQSFLVTQRTGPANLAPTPSQFQQPFQPQPTGFQQPQPTGFQQQPQPTVFQPQQPQPTGFQPQPTGFQQTTFQPSFLPPPVPTLLPQQTGFQQQMLPPQKTGSAATFKPVSFGTTPKPLVPSRTGKRANLAAASIPQCFSRLICVAPENPFGF